MSANNKLTVTELDFTGIKNNLKEFLRDQDTFKDYDFEGSGMSVLLDVLAYNTYYNGFYLNMIANESFIDTAQIRQNVLSHAKLINYVPQSRKCSEALVNITVTPSGTEDNTTNFITLERNTRFLGTNGQTTNYPFWTVHSNTATKSGASFVFSNVLIRQGEIITRQFKMEANNTLRRFEVPSANIDTDTLIVSVQKSNTDITTTVFSRANDITALDSTTPAYFIEENENGFFTIYFGDDILGQAPENGNIINVTYFDTMGELADGVAKFNPTQPIADLFRDNVIVQTVVTSSGGAEKETIDNIRFRAPRAYTTQNRAVNTYDYENILLQQYPYIDSVTVWGGEDNDPIVYGKVYISAKTRGYFALSNLEKERIKQSLTQNASVMTIIPEFVDPDFVFVMVRGTVKYNSSKTSKSVSEIRSDIRTSINNYAETNLNDFGTPLLIYDVLKTVEDTNASIEQTDVSFWLQKRIDLITGATKNYYVNFGAPIKKGSVKEKLYSYPQINVFDNKGQIRQVFFEEVPLSYTGIESIDVINAGYSYTSVPTVLITGDGENASAIAKVVNGKIESIEVINAGHDYTRATATLVGGGGFEAELRVKTEGRYGTIRTYYYKSNGEKVVVNAEAGTIDYMTGKVVLNSLFTTGAASNPYYEDNVLTINVVSDNKNITPLRNRILALDTNNEQSVQIDVSTI